MIDYEKNIKEFFKEHLHEHEEIRLILGGGGAWILTRSFLGFCWCVNYAFFLISGWLLHWRRMYVDRLRNFFVGTTYDRLAGYEDIRDFDGRWIRIHVKKGDLIILPPGMYHRFTLDDHYYVKVSCCCTLPDLHDSQFISTTFQLTCTMVGNSKSYHWRLIH